MLDFHCFQNFIKIARTASVQYSLKIACVCPLKINFDHYALYSTDIICTYTCVLLLMCLLNIFFFHKQCRYYVT